MSATLVGDHTINEVVTYLANDEGAGKFRVEIHDKLDILMAAGIGPQRLGESMLALNCKALEKRYQERAKEYFPEMETARYCFEETNTSLVQVYKSLQCWLYQCNEGDIDKTVMYQTLDRIGAQIAEVIVLNSPEYEKARWF